MGTRRALSGGLYNQLCRTGNWPGTRREAQPNLRWKSEIRKSRRQRVLLEVIKAELKLFLKRLSAGTDHPNPTVPPTRATPSNLFRARYFGTRTNDFVRVFEIDHIDLLARGPCSFAVTAELAFANNDAKVVQALWSSSYLMA